jgi:hypothetical protein
MMHLGIIGGVWNSAVLHTLPLLGSLNSGYMATFRFDQICLRQTSYTRVTLYEIAKMRWIIYGNKKRKDHSKGNRDTQIKS